jgi:hypothetical protein
MCCRDWGFNEKNQAAELDGFGMCHGQIDKLPEGHRSIGDSKSLPGKPLNCGMTIPVDWHSRDPTKTCFTNSSSQQKKITGNIEVIG